MTLHEFFVKAAIAAFFMAAFCPAAGMLTFRIARRLRRYTLADDARELGAEFGSWFLAVAAMMLASALWWN